MSLSNYVPVHVVDQHHVLYLNMAQVESMFRDERKGVTWIKRSSDIMDSCDLEVKETPEEILKILECNPRMEGSSVQLLASDQLFVEVSQRLQIEHWYEEPEVVKEVIRVLGDMDALRVERQRA